MNSNDLSSTGTKKDCATAELQDINHARTKIIRSRAQIVQHSNAIDRVKF